MIYILVNHTGEESHFYILRTAHATNKTGMLNFSFYRKKNPPMMGKYTRKAVEK